MKKISTPYIIYFISKLLFYTSLAFTIFIILFSALSFVESTWGLDIPFVEILETDFETRTRISVPFSVMHIGFPNSILVVFMWFFFAFYTIYFYALSQFFKVFTETNVFTETSLKRLKRFGWLNLIPIVFALLASIVDLARNHSFKMDSEYLLVFVHLLVAMLVYFYLQLVKKGKMVQDENDLTI